MESYCMACRTVRRIVDYYPSFIRERVLYKGTCSVCGRIIRKIGGSVQVSLDINK